MNEKSKTSSAPPSASIRPSGGYRELRSFQVVTIVYDATVLFCERFVDRRSRTVDQMVQAARSGRQNIAEGSRASATSSQTELHLVNVARSSLDELLLDYEDFLRQRRLAAWTKHSPESMRVRAIGRTYKHNPSESGDPSDPATQFGPYAPYVCSEDPAVAANTLICLIHQANYLLNRQIAGLESKFIQEGGYSERLAAARIAHRSQASESERGPVCPLCDRPMSLRTARKGPNAGRQFWGCSGYPQCKGTRPLDTP